MPKLSRLLSGQKVDTPWHTEAEAQPLISRRIVVTNPAMNGKTLGKMHFSSVYGVNITRVTRQGMDLFASRNHRFQIGDRIMVVGPEDNVNRIAEMMGNSTKRLDAPNIGTIFIGIIVGILFGSIPLSIPGMPVPLKLWYCWWPIDYCYPHRTLWLSVQTCYLYHHISQHDAS